ncbi:LapA family protein [Alsobacter sp. SYSU M60028]|uniref:LapA family protein n=1 Tax=Alsobacter ponti TaxID=2962936 RepID=A0ABT1LBE5_9HYPH|nr:LapA family protein [Alsobacter ponti]MCP8938815.1 LapA family protein [Alsobacter ponti]
MKSFLKALILLPVVALVTLFAVANREPVAVQVDPYEWFGIGPAISLPLFAIVFLALAVGVVLGGSAVWLSQGRHRKAARLHAREAARLRDEAERLRASAATSTSADLVPSSIR